MDAMLAPSAPASVSRYRSVRRAEQAAHSSASSSPPPLPPLAAQPNVQRSMSRYRHHKPQQTAAAAAAAAMGMPQPEAAPPLPPIPQSAMRTVSKQPSKEGTLRQPSTRSPAKIHTSSSAPNVQSPPIGPTTPARYASRRPDQPPNPDLQQPKLSRSRTAPQTSNDAEPRLTVVKVPSASNLKMRETLRNSPSRAPSKHQTAAPPSGADAPVAVPGKVPPELHKQNSKELFQAESERYRKMRTTLRAQRAAAIKEEEERKQRTLEEEQLAQRQALEDLIREQREEEEERVRQAEQHRSVPMHEAAKAEAQRRLQVEMGLMPAALDMLDSQYTRNRSPASPKQNSNILGMIKRKRTNDLPARSPSPPPQLGPNSTSLAFRGLLANNADAAVIAAPGADAPISAVNAGERRVTIECGKSRITLPVTHTTNPVDLVRSASTVMSENINPKSSVLLEAFGKVGVQRPLRKYEHVRNVLNSWDDDMQNSLILVPSATDGNDPDLEAGDVPKEQPGPASFFMWYSQKPGKWEKRWITVRQDGTVTQAKKEDSTTKETSNICHLSDFDVYVPQMRAASRKIKPPKKHCFAVKSQQKSAMFLSLSSFVHFMCTNDKNTAAEFYRIVQSWRSWYLVNVLGEGAGQVVAARAANGSAGLEGSRDAPGSRDSHYQLGSFKPLLDLEIFTEDTVPATAAPTSGGRHTAQNSISHSHTRSRSQPRATLPSLQHSRIQSQTTTTASSSHHSRERSVSAAPAPSAPADDSGTFAPTGLLGRTYTQRQRDHRDRQLAEQAASPFTGKGLLSQTQAPGVDAKRTSVTLLDSAFHDPSAHVSTATSGVSRGRGYMPTQVGPGGLVSNATTSRAAGDRSSYGAPARFSVDNSPGQPPPPTTTAAADSPFDAKGLLANASGGWHPETSTRGRGVMQGSAATGPMLDIRERSIFAGGSLLRSAEGAAEDGRVAPRVGHIDRSRAVERDVKVGEGY